MLRPLQRGLQEKMLAQAVTKAPAVSGEQEGSCSCRVRAAQLASGILNAACHGMPLPDNGPDSSPLCSPLADPCLK